MVGRGETAFSPFLTVSYSSKNGAKFSVTFIISSANVLNLNQSKILSFAVKSCRLVE